MQIKKPWPDHAYLWANQIIGMESNTPVSFGQEQAVYLQSLGAAGTVTGSKHLLKTPGSNILVDCGLFQGIKSLREKNWAPLSVNPASIDAVILTHAHLDHCGYIPLFVKNGFRGKIFMSPPTRDLTELILRDSAKLQEEDAHKANQHGYSKHHPAKQLYGTADVEKALPHFSMLEAGIVHWLNDNIQFSFYPAGHIAGACSVKINCYGKTIFFSGDIGRYHSGLLPPPTHPEKADFVVMESTYGNRLHENYNIAERLEFIINGTIADNGNILIPCFAVGRAQEIMHLLHQLKTAKLIPQNLPVYLDSPMAASASRMLLKYPDWITVNEKEVEEMFEDVIINEDYRGTEKIIDLKKSKIILAASGMLTGGRVLEYMKHYASDPRNTIIIMGFQAEGTRGRALLEGTQEVKIHGQYYEVKARIEEIGGLSAHADQAELVKWLSDFTEAPSRVYLVHGEPSAQQALRVKLKDTLHVDVTIMEEDRSEFLYTIHPNKNIEHASHHHSNF